MRHFLIIFKHCAFFGHARWRKLVVKRSQVKNYFDTFLSLDQRFFTVTWQFDHFFGMSHITGNFTIMVLYCFCPRYSAVTQSVTKNGALLFFMASEQLCCIFEPLSHRIGSFNVCVSHFE